MATKPAPKTVLKAKPKTESTDGKSASATVAPATVSKGSNAHDSIYEDAVKEIVALGENDSYAKKIDNGPLSESRGKDTWRLHTQLRAVDQLDKNLTRDVNGIRAALADIDQHRNSDTVAITSAVETTRADVENWLTGNHEEVKNWLTKNHADVQNWVTSTHTEVGNWLKKNHKETGDWIASTSTETQAKVAELTKNVKDNFARLAQATAGTEENLKAQTNAFSKAVENLLGDLRHEFDKKISEFRDESTRLIDKRFNQSDVAFAAVRADQEVIKALLTDIIKDRLGRPEPRNR